MARWKCIFSGRYTRDSYGRDYENNRLFIKDGDESRIYSCDNSGTNPGNADDGPVEIDLTQPGWIQDRRPLEERKWDWRGRAPYDVQFPTVCGRITSVEFEGAVFLSEKYGVSIKSKLCKQTRSRILALTKVVQLTEAPLIQLARAGGD